MGIKNNMRGGSGSNHNSGRMDYPYADDGTPKPSASGFTDKVYRYSAATRNATPVTQEEATAAQKSGEFAPLSRGSKAAYAVENNPTSAPGTTMGNVRQKYREAVRGGLSPDDARGVALSDGAGNKAKMVTDFQGKKVP